MFTFHKARSPHALGGQSLQLVYHSDWFVPSLHQSQNGDPFLVTKPCHRVRGYLFYQRVTLNHSYSCIS